MDKKLTITVSGLPCSGSTSLSRLLAKRLQRELLEAGVRYRQEAKKSGKSEEETWNLKPDRLKEIDEQMIKHVNNSKKIIWEGRLSGWFARSDTDTIRIWCEANKKIRAYRYSKREKVELSVATKRIQERENNDQNLFTNLYGRECYSEDKRIYNLIVNSEGNAIESIKYILYAILHL